MIPPTKKPSPTQRNGNLSILLWVDFLPPSVNRTRYLHWTKSRQFAQEAKEKWLSSLRSSAAATKSLMVITSKLHTKLSETLSAQASVLTMPTTESPGSTDSPQAAERMELSLKSTADNAQNPA